MSQRGDELNALMQKHGTDKGIPGNGYHEFFCTLFYDVRDTIKNLLEIGIHKGSSLKLWREWFPVAEIIGIDINPASLTDYGERIAAIECDQSKSESLNKFKEACPGMDIIIDDGSHVFAHQILSFTILWPLVKPGGWYVIEDTFLTDKHEGEAGKIFYEMQRITATLNRYKAHERSGLVDNVQSVTYFDSLIAIRKV